MKKKKSNSDITPAKKKVYERIAEEATMDCYGEYEQLSGWACLLDESIPTPCECLLGKEKAVLEKIDTDDTGLCIVGKVRFGRLRLRVLFQDISFEQPGAMDYANAYRHWCNNG